MSDTPPSSDAPPPPSPPPPAAPERSEPVLLARSARSLRRGAVLTGNLAVVLVLLAMIALPVAATVVRVMKWKLPGFAVMVQHLTLWVGFLGALLATRKGKHLHLSAIDAVPPGWPRLAARLLTSAVSAAVCAVLAYASARLVRVETEASREVVRGVPFWWSMTVMPVACAFMALVFAWRTERGDRWRWLQRGLAIGAAVLVFLLGEAAAPDPGGWPLSSLGALGRGFSSAAAALGSALGPLARVEFLVWLFGLLVGLAFLAGAPVFVGMAGLAMVLFLRDGTPVAAVPTHTFTLASSSTLAAVPLLTVAGYVLAEGGAAQRLVRAYRGLFGWMPGGLAVMAAFVCALFTTFTGASGVTILALGGLILPSLLQGRYPEGFSLGLVTASGSLGLLFPPSLPVILYGVVAQAPIEHLFLGGLLPGLLMIAMVAAYGVWTGVRCGAPRQPFRPREALTSLWGARWDLGLPTLVVVSVVSGYATVVEAAALAAAYSLVVELVVFRSVKPLHDLPRVLLDAATLVGSVLILLGVALGLTSWFVDAEIPGRLVEWMTAHVRSPALFLLMLNAALLVMGSILEIYAAIVVMAPLVAPLGQAYGVDPIHLGVVFLANLELGFLFPPMGLNLFLSASRFQKPLPYLWKQALPFLLIMAGSVLLITYIEPMTTGVVRLLTR
ncbi:MAG TPA: TRAP transporter large permease subunit [Anaeromyxobacteraceae bacterium]|nr:TRAP transporter large permease subunit [Anaeromyxobacteraceae bacterium]